MSDDLNEAPLEGGDDQRRTPEIYDDDEIRSILDSASSDVHPLFEFADLEEEVERTRKEVRAASTQDPESSHTLFYRKIQRILNQYLPGTRRSSEANRLIRDEVTLFLNEGHETGRDSRMTYLHQFEEAVRLLSAWLQRGGADLYHLYDLFRQKNVEHGYRRE